MFACLPEPVQTGAQASTHKYSQDHTVIVIISHRGVGGNSTVHLVYMRVIQT